MFITFSRLMVFMLFLLVFTVKSYGFNVEPDGYSKMWSIFADKTLILLCKNTSGEQSVIIALNPETGKEKWRQQINAPVFMASSDNNLEFYTIENNKLTSRSRMSGGMRWNINLPEYNWPKLKNKETGIKIRYSSEMPALTKETFTVFRLGSTSVNPVSNVFSVDWLVLNRRDFRQLRMGRGEFVNSVSGKILITDSEHKLNLQELSKDKIKDLTSNIDQKYKNYTINTFLNPAFVLPKINACMLLLEAPSPEKPNIPLLYDFKRKKGIPIIPAKKGAFQTKWLYWNEYVIRFSESSLLECNEFGKIKNWVELYDKKGKFLSRLQLTVPPENIKKISAHFLRFEGIAMDGSMVFVDEYNYYHNFEGKTYSNLYMIQIDLSRLSIQRKFVLTDSHSSLPEEYLLPERDLIIQIRGNTEIFRMDENKKKHKISVHAISLKNGWELWRFNEKTTIHTTKKNIE